MISEEKTPSVEVRQRTIDACAWLIDIAQYSVDHFDVSSDVVRFLEALGSGTFASLQGGMGGMTPMERSGTEVETCQHCGANRGRFIAQLASVAARHDKQISGGELMQ